MYQNIFQIKIYGKDCNLLKNTIQTIPPLADSSYEIEILESISCGICDYDCILILNRELPDLNAITPDGNSKIVFITSKEELITANESDLQKITDFWFLSQDYNTDAFQYYFNRTLSSIKEQADNRKLQICFDTLINSIPNLIWFKDTGGAHLQVNDSFCHTVQKTKEQIYKREHSYIWDVPKEEFDKGQYVCQESENIVMKARATRQFDEQVKTHDGMRQFKTYKSPLIDCNDTIFGTCGMATDVTNIRNIRNELNLLIESMPFGIVLLDVNYEVISTNTIFDQQFPDSNRLKETNFKTWKKEVLTKKLHCHEDNNEFNIQSNGKNLILKYQLEPMYDIFEDRIGSIVFFHDITLEHNFQEKLQKELDRQTRKSLFRQKQVERLSHQAIETLAHTIDVKDPYTNGHSARVAKWSCEIAKRLDLSDQEIEEIYYTGLLHDIGKIGIADKIINKPDCLTQEEVDIIKTHPVIGAEILESMSEIPKIAVGAKWHHERYDGKGYPDGLKGNEIPLIARIISVADAYDAMTSKRSYHDALPMEVVRAEIEKGKGTQFDPFFADIMLSIIDEEADNTNQTA